MLLLPHKLAPCSGGTQRLNLYWVVSLRLIAELGYGLVNDRFDPPAAIRAVEFVHQKSEPLVTGYR